jgi:glyoxylase-like metal-dependent hydrolase (beta-lactamase superfamily II)
MTNAPVRALLLALLMLLPVSAVAWEARPEQVADGVYAFIGETGARSYDNEGMNANSGFVVTPDGVVVIDSGASREAARKIHEAIRSVTDRPLKWVVNTGGQDHRWLGNGYFAELGISVVAHENTVRDNATRGAGQAAALQSVLQERFAGTRPSPATRTFRARERIELGGVAIDLVFAGGGHTPGDIVVWLPGQRIAFAGDIVYVRRLLGVLPVSSVKNWLASFDALAALQPAKIVPGHGPVTTLDQAKRQTRDYLQVLREHMKRVVDAGVDLQAAIDSMDDRAWAGLENYRELRGGNASRAYLEAEGE